MTIFLLKIFQVMWKLTECKFISCVQYICNFVALLTIDGIGRI